MTERIQILDKRGMPLAQPLADDRRWHLPGGVGLGVKYSGQIYPLVNTTQGWVIKLGGHRYAQKDCRLADPERSLPQTSQPSPPPVVTTAARVPASAGHGVVGIEKAWLANAEKAETQRAESAARQQQVRQAVVQLHGELADAREEQGRLAGRVRHLEAELVQLRERLRDDRRLQKSENTVADLRGQLTYAQRQMAAAQAEAKQAREAQKAVAARATASRSELAQQRQETAALEQRLKACLAEMAKGVRPEAWDWFLAMLPVVWPRLSIRAESWEVVSRHCTRVDAVLRVLQALHDEDPNQAAFSIADHGWREVQDHIATGRDDRLRVYWRPLPERRLEAVIFYKTDDEAQQAFHRALAREPVRKA